MPPRKRYEAQITVPLEESEKALAEALAQARRSSVSQICREALGEYLKKHAGEISAAAIKTA